MPTAAKIRWVGIPSTASRRQQRGISNRRAAVRDGHIHQGLVDVTFSTAQTLPANTVLLFGANTKDCVPDSWPNNCNFKAYFTSAAINNATTVTLTAAYSGSSSSNSTVWNHTTKNIATGDQAEAMYSVVDGKSYGQWCCFDYGNAEFDGIDDGNATMEAIYWGADTQFGQSGGGSGPWVAADLENGMFEGYENGSTKVASNTSVTGFPYVTAMLKGLSAPNCPAGLDRAPDASRSRLATRRQASSRGSGTPIPATTARGPPATALKRRMAPSSSQRGATVR